MNQSSIHPLSWLVVKTAHLGIRNMADLRNATGELKKEIDKIMHQEIVAMVKEDEELSRRRRRKQANSCPSANDSTPIREQDDSTGKFLVKSAMKMRHSLSKTEVNVTEWASVLGLFEWFFTDVECEDGYQIAVVYGPEGTVEVGEVDMKEIKKFPGYFPPSPITKTMSPPPGWEWVR